MENGCQALKDEEFDKASTYEYPASACGQLLLWETAAWGETIILFVSSNYTNAPIVLFVTYITTLMLQ